MLKPECKVTLSFDPSYHLLYEHGEELHGEELHEHGEDLQVIESRRGHSSHKAVSQYKRSPDESF